MPRRAKARATLGERRVRRRTAWVKLLWAAKRPQSVGRLMLTRRPKPDSERYTSELPRGRRSRPLLANVAGAARGARSARGPRMPSGHLVAAFAEAHEALAVLVPQLEPDRPDPVPQRERRHAWKIGVLVVGPLQVVVGDPRAQVVDVVVADVAGEELERPAAASGTSFRAAPRRRSPGSRPPSRRPRTGAARRTARFPPNPPAAPAERRRAGSRASRSAGKAHRRERASASSVPARCGASAAGRPSATIRGPMISATTGPMPNITSGLRSSR